MKTRLVRVATAVIDGYYRKRNGDRPRVLVYTDSRGYNVISKLGKTAYGSYIARLQSNYNVTYAICPEKYTTIVDFLNYIGQLNPHAFDAIIMHCGVVDFSPRPLSNIENFKINKASTARFQQLFDANETYYSQPSNCLYYGEPTINIYSKDYLINYILPDLKKIPNLIWINSNKFVPGWEGNYTKGRPNNIEELVSGFDQILQQNLDNFIDLKKWSPDEIKKYTIDNIHFSTDGFNHLYHLIYQKTESLIKAS